jgi:ribosomal protein S1
MAKDALAQAPETFLETFIVVNGTLVHDGQTFPVGAEYRSVDTETNRVLLACRAIARPEEAARVQQLTETLDENTALKGKVQELERQIAAARATIEKRERVI